MGGASVAPVSASRAGMCPLRNFAVSVQYQLTLEVASRSRFGIRYSDDRDGVGALGGGPSATGP